MRVDRSVLDRRLSDESGSMVLALLATIVAAGLMTAIASYAFAGQRQVSFDRDHTRVIQHADAAVNDVLFRLSLGEELPQAAWQPATTWGTLGSGRFKWRVDSAAGIPGAKPGERLVTGVGVYGQGSPSDPAVCPTKAATFLCRRVKALVSRPQPFQTGVFADNKITLVGANTVDSYGPAGNRGIIGSNGNITINGNATADGVELHNYATSSGPERCVDNTDPNLCAPTHPGYVTQPETQDLSSPAALSVISEKMATCTTLSSPWTGTPLSSGTYCVERIKVPADAVVAISGTEATPVEIIVTGPTANDNGAVVEIGDRARLNCPTLSGGQCSGDRLASRLRLYTASPLDVRIGNHAHYVGTIFAPRSWCRGNLSNSHTQIYGSMVCRIVTNQGGWKFHYDERLAGLGIGDYRVRRWTEG